MVCGGVSGMESRTPHGPSPSTCSGSSWLVPHTWVANGAPGTTSTRPGVGVAAWCVRSQSAASCQYWGSAPNVPGGATRPVHASEVLTISAVRATTATATRLSRSGCANARSHAGLGALPGSGTRLSSCAKPSTRGSRITGPTLCTLRRGVPAASRNACTGWATGEASPPRWPTVSSTTPTNSIVTSRPRAGIAGLVSPASPAAATRQVPRMAADPVTNGAPAVAFGATNGVQLSVPRSTSTSEDHCVVTPEDSMKSRNGGLTPCSCVSAITHHSVARAIANSHHAV
ncbi:Uncharacterised protein [Mycobacterium tuberculosis]|nr:Uncharacterised protein [Mycobacterium tuberculosis]CNX73975.1 Uncharacterised protein [Mycobacterium tuberculosis]CNY85147.1 Uncharacterised protein [Mycobacterium tuberculosis]CNZ09722.1 Uncharacterised protein [Mycobacterium tuberculosis]CNZ62169.1 Uncharacterised protein [Mycobacterium tuberculosis]